MIPSVHFKLLQQLYISLNTGYQGTEVQVRITILTLFYYAIIIIHYIITITPYTITIITYSIFISGCVFLSTITHGHWQYFPRYKHWSLTSHYSRVSPTNPPPPLPPK